MSFAGVRRRIFGHKTFQLQISCNLVKMAIRGVYGFTVASVCFDTGNSMQMIKEQTDRCRICAYRIEVSRTMDAERLK